MLKKNGEYLKKSHKTIDEIHFFVLNGELIPKELNNMGFLPTITRE
jgi:hypothetical protein